MPSRVLCTRSPENMPNTFLFLKGLKEGGKEEYWGAKTERKRGVGRKVIIQQYDPFNSGLIIILC